MIKYKKIFIGSIILLCLSLAGKLNAQVTIGSPFKPNLGALLDLKEKDDAESMGGANSTRGLLLPRVKLTSLNNLNDISGASGAGYEGLTVYNVPDVECPTIPGGVYTWNGTQWDGIGIIEPERHPEVKELVDIRDGQKYLYRQFGTAGTWMLENLNYIDPTFAEHTTQAGATDRRYTYPTNIAGTSVWIKQEGLLYSYSAASMGANDTNFTEMGNNPDEARIQGACPPDWHLPSDYEWSLLEQELATSPQKYSNQLVALAWIPRVATGNVAVGNKDYFELQGLVPPAESVPPGFSRVMALPCLPPTQYLKGFSFTAKQGGFAALPVGSRSASVSGSGALGSYGSYAGFWTSSTTSSTNNIWYRNLSTFYEGINRNGYFRSGQNSVRCKKDID